MPREFPQQKLCLIGSEFVLSPSAIMTLDELYEEFAFLDDWDDRCDLLIDLGFELTDLPESAKTEANRVKGCQNNVWLITSLNEDVTPPVMEIQAKADAYIVDGLIVVLLAIFNHKSPEQVLAIDAEAIFNELHLEKLITPLRRNGLAGMVRRIKEDAVKYIS